MMTSTQTTTFRQYVRTGEWADESTQLVTCYTDHMAKSVEYAAYSGDDDGDRYFTLIDGKMVEVEFRSVSDTSIDSDDYMHTTYGVFVKGDEDGEPIDTFHVRIDGRA